ncbi:MAG: hypothetical protein KIPDCIKN_02396 [Haliscomenobacter sp.]|nr:hypothetical protein [Haliscomenobacter sp.]
MNQAHLHLLFNHLPILGTLFGLLILASGYVLKNNTVKRTALGIFVLSALCVIPAYLTGEGAEEITESLPGVTENFIEAHENMANIFLGMAGALGLLSLGTFFTDLKKQKITPVLYAITLVVALGTLFFAQQTGSSGGKIRHTEIRSGVASPGVERPGSNNGAEAGDEADN